MEPDARGEAMSHSDADQYPAGVPCWIDTAQPDVEAALGFYGELFGWEFAGPGPMSDDPAGRYYVARLDGRDVAGISTVPSQGAPPTPGWLTHVAVEDAGVVAAAAREAGGTVVVAPFDALPAGRMAVLRDPAGALFAVWEARERRGAEVVNAPSAWAMSALSTSDPEGARAFYGSLFGWEAEPFGPEVTVLRRPGYVGGQPEQPVPRDVVAVMMQGEGDAVWNVDLWVADADAIAAKASKLGGAVLAEPSESQGFRHAVISDPQGAVLSVSQLLAPPGEH
jgi:uncharacterized protein